MTSRRLSVEERFASKYIPEPNSGCWLWIASCVTGGYGKFFFQGKYRRAHRVAWVLHRGLIPPGLDVLHRCDTSCCVNPDHLFLGTDSVNMRDCVRKGRYGNQNTGKTVCAHGHPLIADNVYLMPAGGRSCRICHRATKRRWRAQHLEKARRQGRESERRRRERRWAMEGGMAQCDA
jgi:hypothetical protein